jgi:molecular chaperone GrpE (heat shock protein)
MPDTQAQTQTSTQPVPDGLTSEQYLKMILEQEIAQNDELKKQNDELQKHTAELQKENDELVKTHTDFNSYVEYMKQKTESGANVNSSANEILAEVRDNVSKVVSHNDNNFNIGLDVALFSIALFIGVMAAKSLTRGLLK